MGSKSKSKNNSTSTNASQMAALQRNNPATTMAEAQGNQQALQSSLMEQVMPAFSAMMQMGQQQMDNNPMMGAFGQTSDREMSTLQEMIAALQPQQTQQQSPYDQRIGQLMQNQGMSRQGAMDNQAHAIKMGADYNNDGSVGNDEWRQYKAAGQTAPSSASLYEQMMGNPYAGIQKDV